MFQNIISFTEKLLFPLGFITFFTIWQYRRYLRKEEINWKVFFIFSYFLITSSWRLLCGMKSGRYMLSLELAQIPLVALCLYSYDFPLLKRFFSRAAAFLEKNRLLVGRLAVAVICLIFLCANFHVDPYSKKLITAGKLIKAEIRAGEKAVLCDIWEAQKTSRIAYYSGLANMYKGKNDIQDPAMFKSEALKFKGASTIYWVVKMPAKKVITAAEVGVADEKWQCIFSAYRNRKARQSIQVYRMRLK